MPDIINTQMHCSKFCLLLGFFFTTVLQVYPSGTVAVHCQVAIACHRPICKQACVSSSSVSWAAPGGHRQWREDNGIGATCQCKWLIPSGPFQACSLISSGDTFLWTHPTLWLAWSDNTPFIIISGYMVT